MEGAADPAGFACQNPGSPIHFQPGVVVPEADPAGLGRRCQNPDCLNLDLQILLRRTRYRFVAEEAAGAHPDCLAAVPAGPARRSPGYRWAEAGWKDSALDRMTRRSPGFQNRCRWREVGSSDFRPDPVDPCCRSSNFRSKALARVVSSAPSRRSLGPAAGSCSAIRSPARSGPNCCWMNLPDLCLALTFRCCCPASPCPWAAAALWKYRG